MAVQGAGVGSELGDCLHRGPGLAQRVGGGLGQPQQKLQPPGGRGDGAEAGGEPRGGVEHCPVITVTTTYTFSSTHDWVQLYDRLLFHNFEFVQY